MTETDDTTTRNSVAGSHRRRSTFEVFERYWVDGQSIDDVNVTERGIPSRNLDDAQDLRFGNVDVHELWDEYLTEFQIQLAQEIARLRFEEQRVMNDE